MTLKVAIAEAPRMFRSAMQKYLDEGVFPEVAGLEAAEPYSLPKAGKPTVDLSAYRPICLIDTVEKVLEKRILKRGGRT